MLLLADWTLSCGGTERRIELYRGDLSRLPPEHAVDILVVSAFRNDYMPTPTSLIGALDRNGVSVHRLSFAKERDLREEFSCWLSQPLGLSSFERILCIESGWRGTPPEIAEDLFRALAPVSLMNVPTRTVAMPLIGAGDQQYAPDQMLESILLAAVAWLRRGMSVEVLKIVAYSDEAAVLAKQRFLDLKQKHSSATGGQNDWDVFLSYAHADHAEAEHVHRCLASSRPGLRIYHDKRSNEEGCNWVLGSADALDSSTHVLALYTPAYWSSKYCKLEFTAAFVRQTNSEEGILFPIFFRDTKIPSLFAVLHYADCREGDFERLSDACLKLCRKLA